MIAVRDALDLAARRAKAQEIQAVTLTRDEERAAAKVEGVIDSLIRDNFDGSPFMVQFKMDLLTAKIVGALKQRYSLGGWRLAYTADRAFAIVPVSQTLEPPKPLGGLPTVAAAVGPTGPAPMRLLVRMPTRGRPAQALEVLQKYRDTAGMPIQMEVVCDTDDETMRDPLVVQRLGALGCTLLVCANTSKIEACNAGRVIDFDVLVLASDDMVPVRDGWALRIVEAMQQHFPHLDGALHFDDGYQGPEVCTLPIMGSRLYWQFGYVYEREYKSLWCDKEQTELLQAMNRIVFIDEKIIQHKHHVWGVAQRDALYLRNDALNDRDRTIYDERKARRRPHSQFEFGAPPMWLSILIITMPKRRTMLDRLIDEIYWQITTTGYARQVEVVVDARAETAMGAKRQALMERSRGKFVCFVDDDDWIAPNYVARVVDAIRTNPDADCASLVGVMTTAGTSAERFEHSVKNGEWRTENDVHLRTPNHLNAVRRDLALKAGFPQESEKNYVEDYDYGQRLKNVLKTEVSTGNEPLYFYYYQPRK